MTADPARNPNVRITEVELLADNWAELHKVTFDYLDAGGTWSKQVREAYDRGNGATVLMVDWDRRTLLLTRQFRVPAYLNRHEDGMLVETPAGILDDDEDEAARTAEREAEEETGRRPRDLRFLFELYMSPGSVTERVAFFAATYRGDDLSHAGGGVPSEGEDIEVLEVDVDQAIEMVRRAEIVDGKTVILLQWLELELVRRDAVTRRDR